MSDTPMTNDAQAGQKTAVYSARPWVRHYEQGVSAELAIPDEPLTWLLDQAVHNHSDQTAIIYYGNRLNYAQLSSLANRFAAALQRLGVQKGDRVAIALPNIPQYLIAFYGALRAGAVVVPTHPLYPLSQRGAKNQEPRLTSQEMQRDRTLHSMHSILQPHTKGGLEVFKLPAPSSGEDLAALQYTGGTTGLSKGAMLTHRNLLANAFQTRYWTPHAREAEHVMLCVAPFFHSYGLTVGMNLSILAAATMVLLPRFKAKDVVSAIRKYHPTLFPGIPTMYLAIMREAGKHTEQLSSIKYCISGAAPLPAKIRQDFEAATHGKLVEGYGLSEAAPVTHCNPLNGDIRDGSVGLPLQNVDAAILDAETGAFLPAGEVGEIVVKGPNIMKGYWKRDKETTDIFYKDWMHTGDLGKMDEDGYFYIVERIKDLIIASGFNVYPREVEEVLFHHPAVAEAAVVGVPDEYRGETVAAFIVLKPGYAASEETRQDILAYSKHELTPYKVPKKLEFRETLPKSLIGKVLRRELRENTLSREKL